MTLSQVIACAIALALAGGSAAADQPPRRCKKAGPCVPHFDMDEHLFTGKFRVPLGVRFVERVQEELERARLERRSFIPELIRTLDEEAL